MSGPVLVWRNGWRLDITLNRPERMNAMNSEMLDALEAAFATAAADTGLRAVVLRGAGGAFSAGGDLKARVEAAPEAIDTAERNRRAGRLFAAVERLPQAVIAAVDGPAMGGGFGLACVADLTLATERSLFGMPEVTVGWTPAQISVFVARRIGVAQAKRIAVFGERVPAMQALRLGIAHRVLPDAAALEAAVAEALEQLRRCAPGAVARTREIFAAVGRMEENALLDAAAHWFAAAVTGEEGHEGASAFVEKRKPRWAAPE